MVKRQRLLTTANGTRPLKSAGKAFFADLKRRLSALTHDEREDLIKGGDAALSRPRESGSQKASPSKPRAQASGR